MCFIAIKHVFLIQIGLDHLNGLELKCVEKCSAYIQNQQPYFSNKKQNGKQNESKLVGGEIEGDLGLNGKQDKEKYYDLFETYVYFILFHVRRNLKREQNSSTSLFK